MFRRYADFLFVRVPSNIVLATILSLCISLLPPSPLLAEDDVVIVPAQLESLEISGSILIENDSDALPIVGHSTAGRGELIRIGDVFTYTPDDRFTEVGLDSFTYWTLSTIDPVHTVFLVRGLDQTLIADELTVIEKGNCQLGPGWHLTPEGQSPIVSMDRNGLCAVRFDLSSGAEYAQLGPSGTGSSGPTLPGPGGGYTEFTIDGGGDIPPGSSSDENIIASATLMGDDGEPLMVFGLRLSEDGLIALALEDDGTLRETAAAELPGQIHVIGLTWWLERPGQMADGGLFLEVDGELVARMPLVRNLSVIGESLEWRIGPQNFVGLQGQMAFSGGSLWSSSKHPRFSPIFSDHGFLPNAWDRTVNPGDVQNGAPPLSTDRQWFLELAPGIGPTQLVDELDESMTAYSARFHFSLDKLVAATNASMTFFEAEAASGGGWGGQATHPFRLELIKRPQTGYAIRATVQEGSFQRSTTWLDVPAAGFSVVEISWLAENDAGAGDGRLHLSVNDQGASLSSIDGASEGIDEVHLGPSNISPGMTGSLILDQFDSWQ